MNGDNVNNRATMAVASSKINFCLFNPGTVGVIVARSMEGGFSHAHLTKQLRVGKTTCLIERVQDFFRTHESSSVTSIKVIAPNSSRQQYEVLKKLPNVRLEFGVLPRSNDDLPLEQDEPEVLTRLTPSTVCRSIVIIDDAVSALKMNESNEFVTDLCQALAHRSMAIVFIILQCCVGANNQTRQVMRSARLVTVKTSRSQVRSPLRCSKSLLFRSGAGHSIFESMVLTPSTSVFE